jgi:hypothetical protein
LHRHHRPLRIVASSTQQHAELNRVHDLRVTNYLPENAADNAAKHAADNATKHAADNAAKHAVEDAAALVRIVRGTPWLCEVLAVVREVGPVGAYVAAGAVRDTVWNFLTRRASSGPIGDIDVVYWSDSESVDGSLAHEARLRARMPELDWEVTNQAIIHLWHARTKGIVIAPHESVDDGVATWPETATAVGVRLTDAGDIDVLAPLGLVDLFAMRLRHNPLQTGPDVFWSRIEAKRWIQRWPELRVVPPFT